MEMYFFTGKFPSTSGQRYWRWLKRLAAVAFGCVLFGHAAYVAVYFPLLAHDRNMARLQIGDSRAKMVALVGEPSFSRGPPQWGPGTVCEYSVYPWLLSKNYRNRSKWRVILDDSDRVVSKAKLNPIGC